MDYKLNQDLERFFDVFTEHVQGELHKFQATPEAKRFDKELCEEIDLLRTSVMRRLDEYFRTQP